MNSKLQALVNRGYPVEDILRLCSFTAEELNEAANAAFKHISRNCTPVSNPEALFVGGQPGCGKSSMSLNIKNKKENIIEIGIDNYRMYHPKYLEMEGHIREHWKNRQETENDSPGNDLADMTHLFAGRMTDKLTELAIDGKYNILLEWGMREPVAPLKTMQDLKDSSYRVVVMFVAANRDLSYSACNLRSNILANSPHIIRRIPKSFHDACAQMLPQSIDVIYRVGKEQKLYDYFSVVNRNGKVLWREGMPKTPGQVYQECFDLVDLNDINDPKLASTINGQEMFDIIGNEKQYDVVAISPISIFDNVQRK